MQIWKQLSVRHGNGIKVIQMDIRMCKGGSVMINEYINELVAYGLNQGFVFAKVLECAGVYKRTPEGQAAFKKFLECI